MAPKPRLNATSVEDIRVDRIVPNPENPRLLFRQGELEQLAESIQRYGIQVPLTVYRRGRQYVLIDGERRWRSARKINMQTVPALVQQEPTPLRNLLMMFNIHSLREQWDLLTIAMKLPRTISLLTEDRGGRAPTERELSIATGLPAALIRRCKLLIALPEHHRQAMLTELRKPKSQQQLTEDFYIEMERALTTVSRKFPSLIPDRESTRQVLIEKYRNGTIKSLIELRLLPKIAQAANSSTDHAVAINELEGALNKPQYSIVEAYESAAGEYFLERDAKLRARQLVDKLSRLEVDELDTELRGLLKALVVAIKQVLGKHA